MSSQGRKPLEGDPTQNTESPGGATEAWPCVDLAIGEALRHVLRIFAYVWAFPTTCVGLLFLPLAIGGGVRPIEGVLELHGPAIAWVLRRLVPLPGGASAMTLGHVIIGRDAECLEHARTHEHVHVRQAERWGPLFIPAYFVAAAIVWICGGQLYWDNPFEREAYRQAALNEGSDPPTSAKQ